VCEFVIAASLDDNKFILLHLALQSPAQH